MLARYRPFDVDRAKEDHGHHNPLNLAELEIGATQSRLLYRGLLNARRSRFVDISSTKQPT